MKCPSLENLLACAEADALDPELAGTVAHLAAGCRHCSAALAWYKQVTAIAASDAMVAPPPWVLRRALKLFTMQSAVGGRVVEKVGRILAALVFDSFSQAAVV